VNSTPQPFRLVLASASPRRRELLTQAGYVFTVEAADIDESQRKGESPTAYVLRLAGQKAQAVFDKCILGGPFIERSEVNGDAELSTPLIVLGADTTVVLDGEILGKPIDAADAKRMLCRLSGRTHQVLTGIAVAARTGITSAVESTDVTFSNIPEIELDAYCATSEPLDKAGAYGIQGYAARWIPRIDGCYFNVMGLPIARTVALLNAARVQLSS
jgi:nucleoside triphosphate pyrophosphatase